MPDSRPDPSGPPPAPQDTTQPAPPPSPDRGAGSDSGTLCPRCGKSFNLTRESGEVACPHCGAELQAEAIGQTRMLHDGQAEPRPEPASLSLTRQFANYEILEEIGRGGMGVVYKALDRRLGRCVALKVLLTAEYSSEEEIGRFYREASSAAKLQHPNIVPIHELRIHEGKHYYTMDFIEGRPLAQLVKDRSVTPARGAEVLEKVARALDYAHSQGIVHRDLKPDNVIIDVAGQPRVTDFGLVKVLSAEEDEATHAGLTRSGAAMGTPCYEAPEQAAGRNSEVDARTDVYALGCILYEILCGVPPFVASTALEVLRMQMEEDPIAPSRRGSKVPADLETICLKCLAKEKDRRYQSAASLADDLRRFLDGEPVAARRASLVYVARRKLARHRTVAAVAILGVAGMLFLAWAHKTLHFAAAGVALLLLVAAWAYVRIFRERNEAVVQRDRALSSAERERQAKENADAQRRLAEEALGRLYFAHIDLAKRYVTAGDAMAAEQLLAACPPAMRSWEWGRIRREAHNETVRFEAGRGRVGPVALSPEGNLVAAGDNSGAVSLWDARSGLPLQSLTCAGAVRDLAFSPDGRALAAASDGGVHLWEGRSGTQQAGPEGRPGRACSLAFSPAGQFLAWGDSDGLVQVWDLEAGRTVASLEGHASAVWSLAYSPDGRHLASGSFGVSSSVIVWDLAGQREPMVLGGFEGTVFALRFSPDGGLLATADWGGHVKLWDAATGSEISSLEGHAGPVRNLVFRADGRRLVSGGDDRTSRTWDPVTGRLLDTFTARADSAPSYAYLPDARRVVLSASGSGAKLWVLGEDPTCLVLKGHADEVCRVAWSPDGRRLASAGADGKVRLWSAADGAELTALGGGAPARCAAFVPGGDRLFSGDDDGAVRLWDCASLRELLAVQSGCGAVQGLAVSPDGELVAVAGSDGRIALLRAADGRPALQLEGHPEQISRVAFAPNGRLLASAGHDGTVRLWDIPSGRLARTLGGPGGPIRDIAFSPCGTRLAAADRDQFTVSVWDVVAGLRVGTFGEHTGAAMSVAWSPDGRRLASGSYASDLRLWEPETGRNLLTLPGHNAEILALAFSPNGRLLASAGRDQTVRLWLTDEWREPDSSSS